jgi:ribosomal protein S12 methylthiotransferase
MNRKSDGKSIRKIIEKLRNEIPNVIIRTTVMVGFPGETKEDFEELYNFIKEAKFDQLGAFSYSKEAGTPAEKMDNQVHPQTKKSRYNKIMSLQQQISNENLKKQIGRELDILVETKTFDGKYYVGRSYMEVPDIDGLIYIKMTDKAPLEGKFVKCKIIDTNEYDLIAEIVEN